MMTKMRVTLFLLLLGIVSAAPIFAGSAALGTVAGSLNASVSGQALLPNSTVFNGDQLQVKDGAAVIALANGSRMTLGSETQAQFFKQADGVAVALAKGNVSMFHPAKGSNLAVNVQKWSITPGQGYKSVGEVAMLNGAVVVTAKEGSLHVQGNGRTIDVAQGKTITLVPKTAAMPQTGTSQKLVGGNTGLEAGALGVGAAAAMLAGGRASWSPAALLVSLPIGPQISRAKISGFCFKALKKGYVTCRRLGNLSISQGIGLSLCLKQFFSESS